MEMPQVQYAPVHKLYTYPLNPIFHNESTNEGNIAILHNIFESQFYMAPDDPSWATTIRLVYGNMKTVARMLSVIGIRSDPNTKRPFDRLQWLLPGIGLWHL